jgi:hypothetical protein
VQQGVGQPQQGLARVRQQQHGCKSLRQELDLWRAEAEVTPYVYRARVRSRASPYS